MLARIDDLRSVRADFSFETTRSGRSHARFLARLRQEGYWVELLYVTVQAAEVSVERVAHRVSKGRHSIPPDDIRRRFLRSRQNLVNLYMPVADRWSIWDNTGDEPRPVARGHLTRSPEVFDPEFYDAICLDAQRADH